MDYPCTKYGADISSRCPLNARTDRHTERQTDVAKSPTHAQAIAGVSNYKLLVPTGSEYMGLGRWLSLTCNETKYV